MDFETFLELDEIVKRYTESYVFYNRAPDLAFTLDAHVNENDKEWILSEFDCKLPYGTNFRHTYKNGKLQVIFNKV